MRVPADNTQKSKNKPVVNDPVQKQNSGNSAFRLADKRPEAVARKKLQGGLDSSPRVKQLKALQEMMHNSSRTQQALQLQAKLQANPQKTAQRENVKEEEEKPLQGKFGTLQPKTKEEEEEKPVQGKFGLVQRSTKGEEEEEKPLQGKFGILQPKTKEEEEEKPVQGKFGLVQRSAKGEEEEEKPLQGKFGTLQPKTKEEEEEKPVQGKFGTVQRSAKGEEEEEKPLQKKTNNTGLADTLKTGVENLSGYSLDDVNVHYNSDKPKQLQAHAYAQGTDIHVAPGQEKHLPHEVWHVVQQKQGRVKPTMRMKGGVNVNDDKGLEKEADAMGTKAISMKAKEAAGNTKKTVAGLNAAVQLKPVKVKIKGITHLVKIKGKSIFQGEEFGEVNSGTQPIQIDNSQKIRSRRGPNQETYKEHDEKGEHIYRWFKVLKIGEKTIEDGVYLRDDTFNVVEETPEALGAKPADLGHPKYRHRGESIEINEPVNNREEFLQWLKKTGESHLPVHLTGEVNHLGQAVGGHMASIIDDTRVKIVDPKATVKGSGEELIQAKIAIYDDKRKDFVTKKAMSTFFPNSWSMGRILKEVARILSNPKFKVSDRKYKGLSSDGAVTIEVRLTGKDVSNLTLDTVFPIY